MKITSLSNFKMGLTTLAASSIVLFSPVQGIAQTVDKAPASDTFEKKIKVSPKGSTSKSVLLFAPNPKVVINGEEKIAAIVVDLSKNILYKYNSSGVAESAYLVASGKTKYPTDTGVRVVTHVERYPYKSAPAATRRYRKPAEPRIICLEKIDIKTGERSSTGEFIHGNNNPASLGKYASLGCVRMDNEVIKELAAQVKRGDIVIMQRK